MAASGRLGRGVANSQVVFIGKADILRKAGVDYDNQAHLSSSIALLVFARRAHGAVRNSQLLRRSTRDHFGAGRHERGYRRSTLDRRSSYDGGRYAAGQHCGCRRRLQQRLQSGVYDARRLLQQHTARGSILPRSVSQQSCDPHGVQQLLERTHRLHCLLLPFRDFDHVSIASSRQSSFKNAPGY